MTQRLTADRATSLAGCEIGGIAGNGGLGLAQLVAPALPQPHDGVVSVDETRIPGMKDHVVLPVSHTPMMVSREVVHQTCAFLAQGQFDRAPAASASVN